MDNSVFQLPLPLLLLVHLHILEYPHVNDPEYDINVFNSRTRGLRDRARSTQDIFYFLVGKIERTKARVQKILPSYPCLKPADTTTFRNSLAKYIENLRHQAIASSADAESPTANVAWWWRDVVVRKSLLEQCEGEKFMRMVVCLSTHALFIAVSATNATLSNISQLSGNYASRLESMKYAKNGWVRTASLILQRSRDLSTLRTNLVKQMIAPSKYGSLSTSKLIALLDSKGRDLKHNWTNRALEFILELSGLKMSPTLSLSSPDTIISTTILRQRASNSLPQVLPVAAAHHLSNLRKLKKPVLAIKAPESITINVKTETLAPYLSATLSDYHDAQVRMHQNLQNALTIINRGHDRYNSRIKKMKNRGALSLNLRQPPDWRLYVDFETPPDPSLFSLSTPDNLESLEERINRIRHKLPVTPAIGACSRYSTKKPTISGCKAS
ncbi:uncharacterized protein BT62DRAFT_934083 [Guyanagaster necrorhizus]|uniref:Uncharacterized protein n=1 Tax=Guyanagaster necrorhizus TaxID=856835 RepID=A0A9P8AQS2_9AGAR|nr:uncharacterized protein BT62DRAFT_934083 [Guyanagaster necrorhizus MCA 3950]KAG7444424.1 hypothetical protein BT62DRAFT_934083 [Guyanagaster necrorhizus MCA 3950]